MSWLQKLVSLLTLIVFCKFCILDSLLSIIHIWNQRLAATCVESDMNTEQKCPLYYAE